MAEETTRQQAEAQQIAAGAQQGAAPAREDAWYPEGKKDWFILKQLVAKDFKLKYRS